MSKLNRGLAAVLFAFSMVLAAGFVLSTESEAATGNVRRAPVSPQGSSRATARVFAAGAGTQRSPFVIRTAAQLSAFASSVNGGETYAGKYIRLGADIDLKNVVWVPIGVYNADGNSRSFRGFFNGGGFTVINMGAGNSANQPARAFFGALDGATIENVSLQLIDVNGESNVGGLVAYMSLSTLKNCYVSGNVKGRLAVGGVVGSAIGGSMENCNFSGRVVGENGVGGLVGAIDRSVVRSSSVTGQVEGVGDVGGFVGGILAATVANCTANNLSVKGESNIGGIAGNIIDSGRIEGVAFNGHVMGNKSIGGLVGRISGGLVLGSSVTGTVKGVTQAGGVVGELVGGDVRRCTSNASVEGVSDIGGLVGLMSGGKLNNSANSGIIKGGRAVGGVAGNHTGGDLDLASNTSTGHTGGYARTERLVGVSSAK